MKLKNRRVRTAQFANGAGVSIRMGLGVASIQRMLVKLKSGRKEEGISTVGIAWPRNSCYNLQRCRRRVFRRSQ